MFLFFFCKQKTAYGVRISDWSSDVCSSDLVEDQQRGPVPLGFAAKQLDDRAQPLVAQRLEDADIDDLVAQLASVEKIERGERLEQPFMAFGQQGDVKHPRAPRRARKGDLVGKYRLACHGTALNNIGRAFNEAAVPDDTDNIHAGRQPRHTTLQPFPSFLSKKASVASAWNNRSWLSDNRVT